MFKIQTYAAAGEIEQALEDAKVSSFYLCFESIHRDILGSILGIDISLCQGFVSPMSVDTVEEEALVLGEQTGGMVQKVLEVLEELGISSRAARHCDVGHTMAEAW